MSALMRRPGLDEHDTGSWLDGAMMFDRIAAGTPGRIDTERWSTESDLTWVFGTRAAHDALQVTLCRSCSLTTCEEHGAARVVASVDDDEPEECVVIVGPGVVGYVGVYAYGRAHFAPGEPRTAPCSRCGVETLRPSDAYEPPTDGEAQRS